MERARSKRGTQLCGYAGTNARVERGQFDSCGRVEAPVRECGVTVGFSLNQVGGVGDEPVKECEAVVADYGDSIPELGGQPNHPGRDITSEQQFSDAKRLDCSSESRYLPVEVGLATGTRRQVI